MSLGRLWAGWRSEFVAGAAGGVGGRDTTSGGEGPAANSAKTGDGAPDCVFCRILASGEPDTVTHVVWRDPTGVAIALLNAYPYTSGHLMVMPLRHVGEVEDLHPGEATALWSGMSSAIRAVKAAYTPDGLNIGANLGRAAGAGVPGHFHIHVLPRWNGDTNFMTTVADARVLPEALSATDEKLRAAWPRS